MCGPYEYLLLSSLPLACLNLISTNSHIHSTSLIQTRNTTYRYHVRLRKIKEKKFAQYQYLCSTNIQRVYRGTVGRGRVIDARNLVLNKKLSDAKVSSKEELKAIVIQRTSLYTPLYPVYTLRGLFSFSCYASSVLYILSCRVCFLMSYCPCAG